LADQGAEEIFHKACFGTGAAESAILA